MDRRRTFFEGRKKFYCLCLWTICLAELDGLVGVELFYVGVLCSVLLDKWIAWDSPSVFNWLSGWPRHNHLLRDSSSWFGWFVMGVSLSLTVSADRYCHLPNQKFSMVFNSAMNHPVRAQAWHWAIPFVLKLCLVGLLHRLLLPTVCLDFSTDFSGVCFF